MIQLFRTPPLALRAFVLGAVLTASAALAQSPARILSIGGDVTEILYALGFGDQIVAVDTTSLYPPDALRDKKNVGYMRALSAEGVLSVGAARIIAGDRAGPVEVVTALKGALPYVEVPEGSSAEGVLNKIKLIAAAVNADEAGTMLAAKVSGGLEGLSRDRTNIAKPLKALFVLNVVNGRATIGGANTSADGILKLAGLVNAAGGVNGFKPAGDEALIEMRPDLIVTMSRSSAKGQEISQVLDLPGLAATPAGQAKRVVLMDANYLLGFGPRMPEAARELMQAAYGPAGSKAELNR